MATIEDVRTGDIVKRRGITGLVMVGEIRKLKTSYSVDFWSTGDNQRLVRTDWIFSGSKMDVRPGCWACCDDKHADCGVCGRIA